MHDEEGTVYSIRVASRKSRPYKNTVCYIASHSKVTGGFDAIHFEIRLERKRAVQAAQIESPDDVFDIDPVALVAKHLTAKDHRANLETIIQRSIRAHGPHPMMQTETRMGGRVIRYGCDRASVFGRYFKKQFERLTHWDCIDVEPVINWAHADVGCDDQVGELHRLLPPRRRLHRERLIIRERL